MVILLNCSNLKIGGGLQVADSICSLINKYSEHKFIVVLSSFLSQTREKISNYSNIVLFDYDLLFTFSLLIRGRNSFLDSIVSEYNVDIVFTVFGPSYWIPKCKHLSGFARSHIVLNNNNYLGLRFKERCFYKLLEFYFRRCSNNYFTENKIVSLKLERLLKSARVYTISNYYNQIFDIKDKWKDYKLPDFCGVTLLTVTAAYPHKNLPITLKIAGILRKKYPEFRFRFVITVAEKNFPVIKDSLKENFLLIGKVSIEECPSLYSQANIMFMPTLVESFTATYPEAMKMEVPIITTDLPFAHGLCGDAALYYSPFCAQMAADLIYQLSNDKELEQSLVLKGKKQLQQYDTYDMRMRKIVDLLTHIVNE